MKLNNDKGYVFLITIFTIVIISILSLSLVTVSSSSLKTSSSERSSQSIFYLAEAGINYKQAILLEKIQKIFDEEKANPANKTDTHEKFETTFTNRIKLLLDQNIQTVLDETYFKNHSNGEPEVHISVTQNGHPRNFTITSTAKYKGQTSTRTVTRNFEIPNSLLTVNSYDVPIENSTPPSSESNITVTNTTKDFRNITAKAYIENVYFLGVLKSDQNARFYVAMDKNKRHANIYNIGVRDYFSYNQKLPTFPTTSAVQIPILNTSTSSSGTLPKNGGNITLSTSVSMPTFDNFTNRVFNIHVPSGEHNIYFKNNFLNYNLASVRFNVTGSGKLNIVFEKYFELNSGRKFVINSPSTKVNTVFKSNASIRGELIAQDLYIEGRFEPTGYGKIISNNIYMQNATFDKDLYAVVNASNVYGENSNIILSSPSLNSYTFFADSVTLENGNLNLEAGGELVVKNNLFVKNGEINALATTCLQAENIVVPNEVTRFHGHVNYSNYYGKKIEMIVSGETNNKRCGSNTTVISPTVPDDTPQTKKVTEYHFKEGNYIKIHNMVEVK